MIRRIRRLIYKVGLRPKPNSIFYSPLLNLIYGFRKGWKKGWHK